MRLLFEPVFRVVYAVYQVLWLGVPLRGPQPEHCLGRGALHGRLALLPPGCHLHRVLDHLLGLPVPLPAESATLFVAVRDFQPIDPRVDPGFPVLWAFALFVAGQTAVVYYAFTTVHWILTFRLTYVLGSDTYRRREEVYSPFDDDFERGLGPARLLDRRPSMMSYVGEIAVLVIFLIGCVAAVSLLQYLARRFTEEEERPKFKVARGAAVGTLEQAKRDLDRKARPHDVDPRTIPHGGLWLPRSEENKHKSVIGATGTGKSLTMLADLMAILTRVVRPSAVRSSPSCSTTTSGAAARRGGARGRGEDEDPEPVRPARGVGERGAPVRHGGPGRAARRDLRAQGHQPRVAALLE